MPLEKYQRRRNFEETGEPRGMVKEAGENVDKIFVIQKHAARNLHYDLRLEIGGVLRSWAVPKEPPTVEGVKRLAVQTEDHPLEYADFEGVIGEGLYGAGTVEIWDKGVFKPEKIEDREILFELDGMKMKGKFVLIKLKPTPRFKGRNNWLFFKKKD
jgi:DNA ligase D-like protein (predicted 3'-phosphoesterase)